MYVKVCDAAERGDLAAVRSLIEEQRGNVEEEGQVRCDQCPLMRHTRMYL